MATKTLSAMRTEIANRVNFTVPASSGTFITISEANAMINASIAELYDLITQKFGNDYFVKDPAYTFPLVSGTESYALPSDFFKLLGVDFQLSSDEAITLKPFMFSERNQYTRSIVRGLTNAEFMRYRIRAGKLWFSPKPSSTNTITVWYVPLPTTLSADGDTFDGYNGWEEYVITDVCIKFLGKEESDASTFIGAKQALITRIEEAAGNRDAGSSARITDVQRIGFESDQGFWGAS